MRHLSLAIALASCGLEPAARTVLNARSEQPLTTAVRVSGFGVYDSDPGSGIVGYTSFNGPAWAVSTEGLVRTDGTPAGTQVVFDVGLRGSLTDRPPLAIGGHLVWRTANDIYCSDGTSAGTRIAWQLPALPVGRSISGLVSDGAGHALLQDGASLVEIDCATASGRVRGPSGIALFQNAGIDGAVLYAAGALYYRCYGATGTTVGLCTGDGTQAGSTPVAMVPNGFYAYEPYLLTEYAGRLVVTGAGLSFVNASGVQRVTTLAAGNTFSVDPRSGFALMGGNLYLRCLRPAGGAADELCRTDGTSAGTSQLDLETTSSATPQILGASATQVFFKGCTSAHGCEPWVTDGTAAGTLQLADVAPGAAHGFGSPDNAPNPPPFPEGAAALNHFFFAHMGNTQPELWSSDGTAAAR